MPTLAPAFVQVATGVGRQTVAPDNEYFPAMHKEYPEAPKAALAKEPEGTDGHSVAPVPETNFPAGHGIGILEPAGV